MMPLNQTRNDKSKDHKFPVAYISNIFKFNDSLIHSQSGEFESTILSPNLRVVQTQAIFYLKSMSNRGGSDIERL